MLRDDSLREELSEAGFVTVSPFLETSLIRQLRAIHDQADEKFETAFAASIMSRNVEYRQRAHRAILDVLREPLAALVEGMEAVAAGFVVKKPNAPTSALGMHQDWSFVDERFDRSLGLWLPLVDVDRSSGCLVVIPGSHLLNRAPRGQRTPAPYKEVLATVPATQLVDVPMRAGQAFLFSHALFHASHANVVGFERVAVYAIMIPASAQLRFYHENPDNPGELEVFEVRRDFYQRYVPPQRPDAEISLGRVPFAPARLGLADFLRLKGTAK